MSENKVEQINSASLFLKINKLQLKFRYYTQYHIVIIQLKIMILEIFLTILVISAVVTLHYCIIVPRRTMNFYRQQLSKTDYKVLYKPFNLFSNGFDGQPVKAKKSGDPYKMYKTVYPHYDIVISNFLNKPVIQLLHVDFIKDYFSFDKHYDYPKIHIFMNPLKRFYGDMSIGMSEGQNWKQRRLNLNKLFTFQFVKLLIPSIVQIADRCIKQMEEKNLAIETPDGKVIEPMLYQQFSLHMFSQVLFYLALGLKQKHQIQGVEVCEYMAQTIKYIAHNQTRSFTNVLGNWFYDLQIRKVDKIINHRIKLLKQWWFNIITEKMTEYQAQMDKNEKQFVADNIIKAILQYKKANDLPSDSPFVSVKYLFSQICGLFVAGTDTTSNFWNVIMCYIGKYPEVEQKAREEIEKFMKQDDYSYDNLKKLVYIDAIEKQVTRIYGPGNIVFPRVAIRDNYINGLGIKKGTMLGVNPIGNQFSQKYFKDPAQFRPERWLNGECDELPPYAVLGFHAGPRVCIGKQLALLETKIAIIKFMKRYKKITIPNRDFKMTYNLTLCAQLFKTKLVIDDS